MARSKAQQVSEHPTLPFAAEGSQAGAVRAAIRRAIQRSGRSVEQLADALSERLGVNVSHHLLYSFTSESHRTHRFPVEWTAAFCRVTGDDSLLRVQAEALGLRVVDPDLAGYAEQRIRAEIAHAEADVLKLRAVRKGLV